MGFPKSTEHSGPMAGHIRKGRVYKSPLAATGLLHVGNWVKDDLPDLLWPALVLAERGEKVFTRFAAWQRSVQDALAPRGEAAWVAERLDGRMTHLGALVRRFPDAAGVMTNEAERAGLLTKGIRAALAHYPHLPAPWLADGIHLETTRGESLELIHEAVLGVVRDDHKEALLKCLRTWSAVQAGTFSSSRETIELIHDFPGAREKRPAADSAIRAMWGAHKSVLLDGEPDYFVDAIAWARVFWGANSLTSQCMRRRDLEDDEAGEAASSQPEDPLPPPVPYGGEHLQTFTMDVLSSFVEALETAPAHLYSNERQEVVSGLVSRAGREVIVALGSPALWCVEHGSHIGRMLVETKIYLHWMARQGPGIYRQFQEYGAGKAKLYARIYAEVPEEARTAGFRESIEELERLSHNNHVLDHRVVDTRDSFADGKSIRDMAKEAGLLDFYRQAYSLASGVAHSEWWSIETHAMEPCLNVLHGMHKVPSLSLNPGGNVDLAHAWVDQVYSLVRAGLQILGTDDIAVERAFAWLQDDESPEPD